VIFIFLQGNYIGLFDQPFLQMFSTCSILQIIFVITLQILFLMNMLRQGHLWLRTLFMPSLRSGGRPKGAHLWDLLQRIFIGLFDLFFIFTPKMRANTLHSPSSHSQTPNYYVRPYLRLHLPAVIFHH
jgi:hypothetical protein